MPSADEPKPKRKPTSKPKPATSPPKSRKKRTGSDYDSFRDSQAAISRERSETGREIGDLPKVKNPKRKAACKKSLRLFCEKYFPERFEYAWSKDHLRALEKLQRAVAEGGLLAFAMPRGTGKSAMTEVTALWAVLYGYRRYVVPIGATQELGDELVESIKIEIETNERLAEDFPEACFPVACLEGINQRTGGQTHHGERTRMDLSLGKIVMPTIPKSACSGARIRGKGLTGQIRGLKLTLPGGKQLRPDLVILDDPQTDESALSPTQNRARERLINGAVLGLAGPRKKIAAVMPCTVIAPDDLADRLLNPEKNPQWNGERWKMLYELPKNMDDWDHYAELRHRSLRDFGDGRLSNEYYAANRAKMDEGAVVAWDERYDPGDLSALQFAMNWRIDRPLSFAAECQNEPLMEQFAFGVKEFTPADVSKRFNGLNRGVVPEGSTRVTAFVDVGDNLLWYCVAAWNEYFGGAVIDYGTYPPQNRQQFAKADARPSLNDLFPDRTPSQRVTAGLSRLLPDLFTKVWPGQTGGSGMTIGQILVDTGDGDTAEAVRKVIASMPGRAILPSKGVGRGKTQVGVARWKLKSGERHGYHWKITLGDGGKGRQVKFDPDAWKTFVHSAMQVPAGDKAGISLFGDNAWQHDLFSQHLWAEYSKPVEQHGDRYDSWSVRPNYPDNDWLDTLVGAALAGSVIGLKINTTGDVERPTKIAPISLRELQDRNRAAKDKEPAPAVKADSPSPSPAPGAAKRPISLRELQQANRRSR